MARQVTPEGTGEEAVRTLPGVKRAAGAVCWGRVGDLLPHPRLRTGAVYVLLHLTFISPVPWSWEGVWFE